MRWFRWGSGRQDVPQDPQAQLRLLDEARARFGVHTPAPFAVQADAVAGLLQGDEGLIAAAALLHEFADSAHAELRAGAADLYRRTGYRLLIDRRNYRALWKAAGPELRWPLFGLPCGWHPYVHVAGAAQAIDGRAKRAAKILDPNAVATHLFEALDLTMAGWEYCRVLVDTDATALADRLISAVQHLLAAMDEPPRLPPPIRELMRRNNTIAVHGTAEGFNPGRTMRERLLA